MSHNVCDMLWGVITHMMLPGDAFLCKDLDAFVCVLTPTSRTNGRDDHVCNNLQEIRRMVWTQIHSIGQCQELLHIFLV